MKKIVLLLSLLVLCISLVGCNLLNHDRKIEHDGIEYMLSKDKNSYVITGLTNKSDKLNLVIPNEYKDKPITSIADGAFRGCTYLLSVTIPDNVTSIGSNAFRGCKGLTSITIPDSVTSIGYNAFEGCSSLTSITIPDSVTSIGSYAFYRCASLTSVTIGNGVTSIGNGAFMDCSSLISVTIGNSVTSIGEEAFVGCSSLNAVYITDIAAWCRIDFDNHASNINPMAYGQSSPLYYAHNLYLVENGEAKLLTDLIIPDCITSINEDAFSGCFSLRSVTIPDSVTSIGYRAFYRCSRLTSITIPDSVTSIGEEAFSYCSRLTSITIPDSVTSIGEEAFYRCSSLTDVYYTGSKDEWNKISIDSYNSPLTSATIHYNYTPEE